MKAGRSLETRLDAGLAITLIVWAHWASKYWNFLMLKLYKQAWWVLQL